MPRDATAAPSLSARRAAAAWPRNASSPPSTSVPGASRHAALLEHAAFVIAPSQWAADTCDAISPGGGDVVAHGSGTARHAPMRFTRASISPTMAFPRWQSSARSARQGRAPTRTLVELTRQRRARLRWVLIGYDDTSREPMQSEDAVYTRHGPFDSRESARCSSIRVRLVAIPRQARRRLASPLRGVARGKAGPRASHRRAGGTGWPPPGGGWILDDDDWQDDARMLERIEALIDPANGEARGTAASARARERAATNPRGDGALDARRLAGSIGARAAARAVCPQLPPDAVLPRCITRRGSLRASPQRVSRRHPSPMARLRWSRALRLALRHTPPRQTALSPRAAATARRAETATVSASLNTSQEGLRRMVRAWQGASKGRPADRRDRLLSTRPALEPACGAGAVSAGRSAARHRSP